MLTKYTHHLFETPTKVFWFRYFLNIFYAISPHCTEKKTETKLSQVTSPKSCHRIWDVNSGGKTLNSTMFSFVFYYWSNALKEQNIWNVKDQPHTAVIHDGDGKWPIQIGKTVKNIFNTNLTLKARCPYFNWQELSASHRPHCGKKHTTLLK